MGTVHTRIFEENGIRYRFNTKAFKDRTDHYAKENGMNKGAVDELLSEKLGVTTDAVKKWKYGGNGPSDPDLIRSAADILHTDWTLLVRKTEEGAKMDNKNMQDKAGTLTARQLDAAKRIYDILIWFMEEYDKSDGFAYYRTEMSLAGRTPSAEDIRERIMQMQNKIELVMNQEFFDLHDHDIYDEFSEFAGEELEPFYEGDFSYSMESLAKAHSNYEKGMNRLNEIIERYYPHE